MSYIVTGQIGPPTRKPRRTLGMIMTRPPIFGDGGPNFPGRPGFGPGYPWVYPRPIYTAPPPAPKPKPPTPAPKPAPAPAPPPVYHGGPIIGPPVTIVTTTTGGPQTPIVDPGTITTLQTNPTALTPAQWAALQAAGLLPGTLPQSDAGLLPSASSTAADDPQCLAAGMIGGPYPNCTPMPGASTAAAGASSTFDFSQIPKWAWVAGGAAVVWYMHKGKR